ncbi:TPA: hypothetical protein DEA21_05115 [Candidatus Uhrbacteria bacterium]|nr:hypothetical protein [Candidatus Uhrbacteria bacterium]HCU31388.1 hypothetical protein [Candidatus Uhrbacteria bacterium]
MVNSKQRAEFEPKTISSQRSTILSGQQNIEKEVWAAAFSPARPPFFGFLFSLARLIDAPPALAITKTALTGAGHGPPPFLN